MIRLAFLIAATLISALALAQNRAPTALESYLQQREANDMATLRALQQYRALQEALLMQQQRQAIQREQRQRDEEERQARRREMQDIEEGTRRSLAVDGKGICVQMFLKDASGGEVLARWGRTVGEYCGCLEGEMLSLLTRDLSGRILLARANAGGNGKKFAESGAAKEYGAVFATAFKDCSDRLRQ
jgi:hypothetical protein